MVYHINKIIGWMTSPLAVTFVVLLAGLVFVWKGKRRLGLWSIGGAFAWLWLWSTPVMTWVVGAPLEREFLVDGRVPAVESFPKADAIVLLGGSMGEDEALSPYAEMWTSADRVWQAARLYEAERSEKVIATGDIAEVSTLDLLLDLGVEKNDITFMNARNTEEEAKGIAKKGYKTILLVTSAWHMKRARLMFEKYAPEIKVICAPADFENTFRANQGFFIVPNPDVFALNSVALHEWVGIVGYIMFR